MVKQGILKGSPEKRRMSRLGGICAAVAMAGVLQITGLPSGNLGLGVDQAHAQRREKPQTRQANTVGKTVGEGLIKAQEAMAVENWQEALNILNRLLNDKDLKPYEQAVILRQLGYVYAGMGNYPQAINYFERAQRLNALDEQGQNDLLFYLGQLYLAEDRVDDAIRSLERWFAAVGDSAGGQAYFVLAQAYAMKENYRRALELAEQGLQAARAANDLRENWFKFTVGMYYQNQQYKNMQNLLREMTGLYPGRAATWNQLAATYSLLDDEWTSYHIRILAYIQDLLTKSNDFVQMGQLHLFYETPIRGARAIEKGFSRGVVEKKADNYEVLSIAYQEAREWDKSIKPLETAANLSEDGDLYVRLCQAHLFNQRYTQAERACVQAINKGKLKEPGQAWLLLGTTRFSQEKFEDAIKAFREAARFDDTKENARKWIRYVENEIKREAAKQS